MSRWMSTYPPPGEDALRNEPHSVLVPPNFVPVLIRDLTHSQAVETVRYLARELRSARDDVTSRRSLDAAIAFNRAVDATLRETDAFRNGFAAGYERARAERAEKRPWWWPF